MTRLFDRYLGRDWRDRIDEPAFWDRVLDIPDDDLWATRLELKRELLAFIQDRARSRWTHDKVSAAQVVSSGTLLDPTALTIGFARRFTGYKRPELILHDPERLSRILSALPAPRADRVRRQVAPRGRHRQAPPAAGVQTRGGPVVRRPHRLHRRLRPARGALSRARL